MSRPDRPRDPLPDIHSSHAHSSHAHSTEVLQTARIAAEAAAEASETLSETSEQTRQRLDSLFGRLQEIQLTLERVRVSLETLTTKTADHESRLRRLERWQHRINPLLGLITFLLGAALTAALKLILPT